MSHALSVSLEFERSGQKRYILAPTELVEKHGLRLSEFQPALLGREIVRSAELNSDGGITSRRTA
jgi:hypothetical protein